jgi:hypothetical protein
LGDAARAGRGRVAAAPTKRGTPSVNTAPTAGDAAGKMPSLIKDTQRDARQVLQFIEEQALGSASGKRIPARIDTFCVHGDKPTAVPVM